MKKLFKGAKNIKNIRVCKTPIMHLIFVAFLLSVCAACLISCEKTVTRSDSASSESFLDMSVENVSKIQIVRYSDDGQGVYMKEISEQEELSSALGKLKGCTSGEETENLQASGWKIMVRFFDENDNFVFSAAEQDSDSFTVSDGSCYKSNCDFGDLLEKIYNSSEAAEQDYEAAALGTETSA